MRLSYDLPHNIPYIRFAEKVAEVETLPVSDDLNIDMTPDGRIYGTELLNANDQLGALIEGKLTIENEATGATTEVAMP